MTREPVTDVEALTAALASRDGHGQREPVPMRAPVPLARWDRVPRELKAPAQWVCWRYEERDGRSTKVPHDARTGRLASVTDPATWSTYEEAHSASPAYAGIGYVLTADDAYVGVDLDHCVDGGVISAEARQIVDELASYTEITPSGHGLRIFVRGRLPPGRRRRGNVEMYESERYLTVTGRHLEGTPLTIEERTPELASVHARVFGQPAPAGNASTSEPEADAALDDRDLLVRALKDERFARLFLGDIVNYQSHSEADLALCAKLAFWTTRNPEHMDRLFRMSGLMREKWDEQHGAPTYGLRTITLAISQCAHVYAPEAEPHFTPIGELLNRPTEQHRFVVADRMPTNGTVLFVGKPKTGKTTTARALVVAVARGRPWLGFPTVQGPVAYVSFDDKPDEAKAHFEKLGVTTDDPIRVYIGRSPRNAVAWLRSEAERETFRMIVVDNLQKLVRVQDARAYAEVTLAIEPIEAIARELGVLLVITHHSPKASRGEDVVDAVLESTAFAGAVDNIFEIRRYGNVRTIRSTQRIGSDLEEVVIGYDESSGVVARGGTWREAQQHRLGNAIVEFLLSRPGVDEPTIMEHVDGRHAMLRRALRAEVDRGRVRKEGLGRRGAPFTYRAIVREPVT